MTLRQLLNIRHFLTKVVVRGEEEHALIEAIEVLNRAINTIEAKSKAA